MENKDELKVKNAESSTGGKEEEKTSPSTPNDSGEKRRKKTTPPQKKAESKNLPDVEMEVHYVGSSSVGSPPEDPKEKLEELAGEIKEKEGQLSETSEELRLDKSDYEFLKKLYDEIIQILAGYEKGLDKLIDRKEDFIIFSQDTTTEIEAVLKAKAQQIYNIISDYSEITIKGKEDEIDEKQQEINIATNVYNEAKAAFDLRINEINESKSKHKDIGIILNKLDEYKKKILTERVKDETDNPHRYKLMCFYMAEFNSKLYLELSPPVSPPESFEILPPEELESELNDAWLHLFDSMEDVRDKKIIVEKLEMELVELEKELKDLHDNRDKYIIAEIKENV